MLPRPALVFANSLDYARHTGGWVYNTRVVRELAMLGWDIVPLDLPAGFPRPDVAAVKLSAELLGALPDGTIVVADQICLSPLASVVEREATRLPLVMIFHHPIAKEEGLPAVERAQFAELERRAMSACHVVIATSQSTAAELLADYGVTSDRIIVAPPGLDRPTPSAPPPSEKLRLLSVGAVIERKGYHVLVDALAGLRDRRWQLDIIGDLDRAPRYVDVLRTRIAAAGLDDRIILLGGLDAAQLEACWRAAHVYVAASFHEGYGMAVAEAIARGLPTVTTRAGAVGDWLDPSAAVMVPEGDAGALGTALAGLLSDKDRREALRAVALAAASQFPTWADAAAAIGRRLAAL